MWQLIGAKSGEEYTRHKDKEALYRLLIKEWPTKGKGEGLIKRGYGGAMLNNRMPEPMIIRRVK
ncbi:hypothetical protein LTWDN19_18730 [Latilactobacillus curvatus]|uniref:Uncharacterized protein n=1 Tax=Latilactobacillus curvatus TaxID=28038 RepID=A0ABN6GLB4_LATCU|nr:hypothetical protein [Latilactobacillus curvatus]BCX31306.1 hypothetical protein LTWDN19_18730 [Latilactobacillus curvatus]